MVVEVDDQCHHHHEEDKFDQPAYHHHQALEKFASNGGGSRLCRWYGLLLLWVGLLWVSQMLGYFSQPTNNSRLIGCVWRLF